MVYDYLLYTGDTEFIKKFVPGIRQTLSMFDGYIQPNGLAGKTRWNYFVDWYKDSNRGGLAPGQDGSNSAVVTLHYVHALQSASKILNHLAMQDEALFYQQRAGFIRDRVRETCYDESRKLFAERPDKSYFDQHTNIMAVLTDAVQPDQQRELLARILNDKDLGQATYYYRFYLFEALRKVKAHELFDAALEPWRELVKDGLTTALERLESPLKPTRSECHPWSAGPAYAYYTLIVGIYPEEIGFWKVRIEPVLGDLSFIEGSYAHRKGAVEFRFEKAKKGLKGYVQLPDDLTGTCLINGKTIALKPGRQNVE